jgi:release factor glutamine methyltransferase
MTTTGPAHVTDEGTWTTRRLLAWMAGHFETRAIDAVLGCDRMRLYMEVDRPATPLERATLRELVVRAARHEPVQYLVGEAWFFGRPFKVNRSVFIPRACTEMLAENVLRWQRTCPGHVQPLLADLGTGSGALAVSFAAGCREAHVVATDHSAEALEVARENAHRHGVEERIEFRLGEGLEALSSGPEPLLFDCICSNPPYISDAEWASEVDRNVKDFQPESALRAGPDGLDVIRPLLAGVGALLRPGGRVFIEIAHTQRDVVLELAQAAGLINAEVSKDHEGLWRMLVAERPED